MCAYNMLGISVHVEASVHVGLNTMYIQNMRTTGHLRVCTHLVSGHYTQIYIMGVILESDFTSKEQFSKLHSILMQIKDVHCLGA